MEIKSVACRKSFTDALVELGKKDKNIVAVTTDARGSVTLTDFAKELPEQFVECGIAEQDAVGISAGLASCGKKVFVCGPACFYVARSLEQVKVDVAYSGQPVKILGVSGGVAYGAWAPLIIVCMILLCCAHSPACKLYFLAMHDRHVNLLSSL